MRRTRPQQTAHVLFEVGFFLASIASRTVNATIYGGSMHQTLSARAHIEARYSPRWQQIERRINRLFFWQANHCAAAWTSEVERAMKTLQRNDVHHPAAHRNDTTRQRAAFACARFQSLKE